MGNATKWFARAGLIAALGLCCFDFLTSMIGIRQVMGRGDDGLIVTLMPIFFAALALCFNALSSHMFRMYKQHGFTHFAPTVTAVMWFFFLSYDALSSFIGILSAYANTPIESMSAMTEAMGRLGRIAQLFVIVMAALLSFGPFLCSMFSDLCHNAERSNS